MPDITFTDIHPGMVYHARVVDLPEIKRGTLAAQIMALANIQDTFALIHAAGAIAIKVARLEQWADETTAEAMADHHAPQEAGNVVRFERRGK